MPDFGCACSLEAAPTARAHPLRAWLRAQRVPLLFALLVPVALLAGPGGTGRLASAGAAIAFLFGFRFWAARFLQEDLADLAAMILASTPLWLGRTLSQGGGVLVPALLAWAGLAWLGGYLLVGEQARPNRIGEERLWFAQAYLALALATLLRGPQALLPVLALVAAFLAWQADFPRLRRTAPVLGGLLVGGGLLLHGLPFFRAWGVRPWSAPLGYLADGFLPWLVLAPALITFLLNTGARRSPAARFLILAVVVPLPFLDWDPSMAVGLSPALALLLASMLQPVAVEAVGATRIRRLGGLLALGLALPGVALLILGWLQPTAGLLALHGPLRLAGGLLLLGALALTGRVLAAEGRFLVRDAALSLVLALLALWTWGARRLAAPSANPRTVMLDLDPAKDPR